MLLGSDIGEDTASPAGSKTSVVYLCICPDRRHGVARIVRHPEDAIFHFDESGVAPAVGGVETSAGIRAGHEKGIGVADPVDQFGQGSLVLSRGIGSTQPFRRFLKSISSELLGPQEATATLA